VQEIPKPIKNHEMSLIHDGLIRLIIEDTLAEKGQIWNDFMGLKQSQAITKVAETVELMGINLGNGEKYDDMESKLDTP
jgi:hypothetical protein